MDRKTYPLEVPQPLWQGYGETITNNQTKDEPLLDHVARRVLDHADRETVTDEQIAAARRQLGMEAQR